MERRTPLYRHRLLRAVPPPPGLLPAALALLLALATAGAVRAENPPMAHAQVVLAGQTFTVELADTPALQTKGLGGRTHLGPHEGMLFLYAERGRHTFWMRGMRISIDMIWLDNSRIVHIEHRVPVPAPGTPPEALPVYASTTPANAVLEIAAGRAKALHLAEGDSARFIFSSSAAGG